MQGFKLTAWNIENCNALWTAAQSPVAATRARAEDRLDAIGDEIAGIAPDILLVCEGPRGEDAAAGFFARTAPGYRLVGRGDDRAYGTKGVQWLWFLVRADRAIDASLGHLDRWRELTERSSAGGHRGGRWPVSYPVMDAGLEALRFSVPERHEHYRHPQVLHVTLDGRHFEIIGCHLKSKINRITPPGDPYAEDYFDRNPALVASVVQSRIKLTTEATDVRHYIEARFAEEPDAAIIVAGDLNDGPGKERIERRFLYHDLIGSLQGDVFFARRFLNHALFDFDQGARWSYDLGRDRLDPQRNPRILLDHILFTQSMTGPDRPGAFAFRARAGGGLVEHEVHHRIAAGRARHARTSDHRAVSMTFDRRPGSAPLIG